MGITVSWQEISVRLLFTLVAGIVLGINRDEKGRPAGIGTNVLVCLAAALAMIQANLLMGTVGKAANSFVVLDLMRLPLGILSGMGFIGAGAILRKEEMVLGVTTAATLWTATVLGLCFGGGQIRLGFAGLALASGTLWGLKWLEKRLPQQRRAKLSILIEEATLGELELQRFLDAHHLHIHSWGITRSLEGSRRIDAEVRWTSPGLNPFPPRGIEELARASGVLSLEWKP